MAEAAGADDDQDEMTRLLDEIEQLRTALEASNDEISKMAEDRDRLLRRVTTQARDLQSANTAYASGVISDFGDLDALQSQLAFGPRSSAEQEELRVAFEEMQVLTEELEVANNSLAQTNKGLDRKVQERTLELEMKNAALLRSERRFRTLVEGLPQLIWRAVARGHWTWASPQWTRFTGQLEPSSHALGWMEPIHPDDRALVQEAWDRAVDTGMLAVEHRLRNVDDGRYRWVQTRAVPSHDETGAIVEWLGACTDIDDHRRLAEQQQVLVAELQHRTRNLIGVVRSIADRTGKTSASLVEFRVRFRDRLLALSRVQSLLSRLHDNDRITFDELLAAELAAMDGAAERVTLDGPPGIRLRSSAVQTLALALHELATNAAKYGALAHAEASLRIGWRLAPADRRGRPWLHIEWIERGVEMPPAGAAPQGGGQGRELIEKALPYQLGAKTTFELGADGVHCTIAIPVSAQNARSLDHPTDQDAPP